LLTLGRRRRAGRGAVCGDFSCRRG